MLKSHKYKKHYRSKYQFPTRVVAKCLVLGRKAARINIETTLKRKLHPDTKEKDTSTQWVFCEPREIK